MRTKELRATSPMQTRFQKEGASFVSETHRDVEFGAGTADETFALEPDGQAKDRLAINYQPIKTEYYDETDHDYRPPRPGRGQQT